MRQKKAITVVRIRNKPSKPSLRLQTDHSVLPAANFQLTFLNHFCIMAQFTSTSERMSDIDKKDVSNCYYNKLK